MAVAVVLSLVGPADARLDERCTAQALNRFARVNDDGSFAITNVPASSGLFRVLVVCPRDDGPPDGALSEFLEPIRNANTKVRALAIGPMQPTIRALEVGAMPDTLPAPGGTAQMRVIARFSDGTMRDVTSPGNGTTYVSSNRSVVVIDGKGTITAGERSGSTFINVLNSGVFAATTVTVIKDEDLDDDGLPDDFERTFDCLDPAVSDAAADADADGLSSGEEFTSGTDPCTADTDGDGLNDREEVNRGSNPLSSDSDSDGVADAQEPAGDLDGDGLANTLDRDSDNDGLPDGIEIRLCRTISCAAPIADNDGDGLSNLDEVTLSTDPLNPDSDGDGIPDGQEAANETDPLVPNRSTLTPTRSRTATSTRTPTATRTPTRTPSATSTRSATATPLATEPPVAHLWRANGPDGGEAFALALDPSNPSIIYAATRAGVFKTIDGAATWKSTRVGLPATFIRTVAVHPTMPQVLYAGGGLAEVGGVYKSTDAGGSWASASEGLDQDVQVVVISPSAPTTIYAGGSNGVFKTTNGGMSWSPTGLTGVFVGALAVHTTNADILYAGVDSGVLKSTDGGIDWKPANSGLQGNGVLAFAIDPTNPNTVYAGSYGQVYRTANAGESWAPTGPVPPIARALEIDPINPTVLYAGGFGIGEGPISKTINSGASWLPSGTGLQDCIVNDLLISPTAPSTLYAATLSCGVLKTTNGGAEWRPANRGLAASWIDALTIDPVNPMRILAGSSGGGFSTTSDGAEGWTRGSMDLERIGITDIQIDQTNSLLVYAVAVEGVFKSEDGGAEWTPINDGLTRSDFGTLAINPANSSVIYLGTLGQLFKSSNAGVTWDLLETSPYNTRAIAIHPSGTTIYAGTVAGVFKSVNEGASWTPCNIGLADVNVLSLAINTDTPDTLYVGGVAGGIYKTINGCNTWQAARNGLGDAIVEALAIDPQNPAHVYAGTRGSGVFRTTTAGAAWVAINDGLATPLINALLIDPVNPNVIYAATQGGGVFKAVLMPPPPPTPTPTFNPNAPPLERGLRSLREANLRSANDAFQQAVSANPSDARANLYYALSRVATRGLDDPQLRALAARADVEVVGDSRNVCALDIEVPTVVPVDAPRSQEIIDTVRAVLLPEIMAAVLNVQAADGDVNLAFAPQDLPFCLRSRINFDAVEIDRADVLVASAVLRGVAAALEIVSAYDGDVDLREAGDRTRQSLIESEPQLLILRLGDRLTTARSLVDASLMRLVQAIDAIESESDDQSDDLLVITPEDFEEGQTTRLILSLVRESLAGEVVLPTETGLRRPQRLNLSRFFSGQLPNLRALLPSFDEKGDFDPDNFLDPTFGNSASDLTQEDLIDLISGGAVCATCNQDTDCLRLISRDLECLPCLFDCSGTVKRCTDGFRSCEDGLF